MHMWIGFNFRLFSTCPHILGPYYYDYGLKKDIITTMYPFLESEPP